MRPGEQVVVDSRGKPSLPKDASWSLESCPAGKAAAATSGKYRDSSGFPPRGRCAKRFPGGFGGRHRDGLSRGGGGAWGLPGHGSEAGQRPLGGSQRADLVLELFPGLLLLPFLRPLLRESLQSGLSTKEVDLISAELQAQILRLHHAEGWPPGTIA